MIRELKKWLLGPYARCAAAPCIRPYPGWTTGSGTGPDTPGIEEQREMWQALREPMPVEWLEGLRINIYPGNETSHVVFLTGLYEPNEFYWLNSFLKPGMIVVDGGANMGLYTLFAARRVGAKGRVLAIEPSAREFGRLSAHVRMNALGNVRCRNVALGKEVTAADLKVAAEWNAGHNTLGEFGYDGVELNRTERVKVVPLDMLIREQGLGRIDLIKLDIEGAEYDALRGAEDTLRRFRPALLLELAERSLRHQGHDVEEIRNLLDACGYDLYGFDAQASGLVTAVKGQEYDAENYIALTRPLDRSD